MRWLAEVLERCGVVPSAYVVDQAREALPEALMRTVAAESSAAVLAMRGLRDGASSDLARELGNRMVDSVIRVLEDAGEDDEADTDTVIYEPEVLRP